MTVRNPPVEEEDEYCLTIEDWGEEGDGVAFIDGFVVFVNQLSDDVELGDKVTLKVTQVHDSHAQAKEIDEITQKRELDDTPW